LDWFLQQLINGLALGSIYALIALGYTMVYGVLRFINFAHADVLMLGAYAAYFLAPAVSSVLPLPSITGALIVTLLAAIICAGIGILIEYLAYRPLRARPKLTVLITAIGVSLFIEFTCQHKAVFGADTKPFPKLLPAADYNWGGLVVSSNDLVVVVVTALLLAAMWFIVQRTKMGTAMRAVSFNQQAAALMGVNINRSFKEYGWCTRIRGIESGGAVEGLPTHTFPTDDGGVDMKCPTEIAISDRREAELAKNGFMPLIHKKNSDFAAFIGAQSLQKPQEYQDPAATANANLAARLPYLFATCRFAHYLKCMVRDKVGSTKTKAQLTDWLQEWLMQYIDGQPDSSSEEYKATHPLAEGQVVVEENPENPGYYSAKFYLKPHYQLEGLTVSLRLVSRLPAG
jgi:ABC-type uncharacterized transport system permease subunit